MQTALFVIGIGTICGTIGGLVAGILVTAWGAHVERVTFGEREDRLQD